MELAVKYASHSKVSWSMPNRFRFLKWKSNDMGAYILQDYQLYLNI